MPLGRLLRFASRILPGPIGAAAGVAGSLIGAVKGGKRRNAAAESAQIPANNGAVPVQQPSSGAAPMLAGFGGIGTQYQGAQQVGQQVPVPQQFIGNGQQDYFNRTGQAVGAALGGVAGGMTTRSPSGVITGAAAGGAIGEEIGGRIPVPGFATSSTPSTMPLDIDANVWSLLAACSDNKQKLLRELLLVSGSLERSGLIRDPDQFVNSQGMIKNGSMRGWVIVTWMQNGQIIKKQMPKELAECFGLHRKRRRPLVSAEDARCIRKANTAKSKVKRVAKSTGLYVADKRPVSRNGKATTRRR